MKTVCYDRLTDDGKAIRTAVFMDEQGYVNEFDKLDRVCKHIVIYDGSLPVGTCRFCKNEDGSYLIGRIAVIKDYRKGGIGRALIESAEREIQKLGGSDICISAQVRVFKFYERLGYVVIGLPYFDEKSLHIKMIKKLKGETK